MPFYLEILITIALSLFIVWNLLFAIAAIVIIRSAVAVKEKTNETLDSIQAAAYTVSENSGVLKFMAPLAGLLSPKKKGVAEFLLGMFLK